MFSSKEYWNNRYLSGGNSGVGSYSKFAIFKAEYVNQLVKNNDLRDVIDFGVGDGNQLSLLEIKNYTGIDASECIVNECRRKFEDDLSKSFFSLSDFNLTKKYDLSLSLDVLYHLIEEHVYLTYMKNLFLASSRFVCIYSSNCESIGSAGKSAHVKHRIFTDWIDDNCPEWNLVDHKANKYPYNGDYKVSSFCDFYVYKKQ